MSKKSLPLLICAAVALAATFAQAGTLAPGLKFTDEHTISGPRNFWTDFEPMDSRGEFYAIVEIPKGTTGKWEVNQDGTIKWEIKDGKPRLVDYQGGYPVNYASSPKTVLAKELGGDGDPVDVLIVGEALPQGAYVKIKLIGILRLTDGGEKDHKLVAVAKGSPEEAAVNSIEDLNSRYKGQGTAIEQWFTNYKGPGKIQSKGWGSAKDAYDTFIQAARIYQKKK
jgi:inorganic pyrophosphatase